MKTSITLIASLISLSLFAMGADNSKKAVYGKADHSQGRVGTHATICEARRARRNPSSIVLLDDDRDNNRAVLEGGRAQ